MNPAAQLQHEFLQLQTRRRFLRDCSVVLAGMWLAQSMAPKAAVASEAIDPKNPLAFDRLIVDGGRSMRRASIDTKGVRQTNQQMWNVEISKIANR